MFGLDKSHTKIELHMVVLLIFILMSIGFIKMFPFVEKSIETQQLYNAQIIYTVAQALEISTNESILSSKILKIGGKKLTLLEYLNSSVDKVKISEESTLNPSVWGIDENLIITAPDGTKYKEGEKIEDFEKIKK